MKTLLVCIFMLFATAAAMAADMAALSQAGFGSLSPEQQAQILQQIAEAHKDNSTLSPKKIDEWVTLGTRIGQMFGSAAKEVGIAVNDFINTPVGKWTMALIIWKLMGGVLMHLAGGVVVMLFGIGFMWAIYRLASRTETTYSPDKVDVFGRARVLTFKRMQPDGEYVALLVVTAAVTLGVALTCTFSYA